jgi:hypothetical protein
VSVGSLALLLAGETALRRWIGEKPLETNLLPAADAAPDNDLDQNGR